MTNHEQVYARLVTEYATSLGDKIATLDEAMRGAQHDVTALAKAREVAHRMRGTAGCYGFRELSDAAGLLDEVLTALQKGQGGSWEEASRSAELVRAVAQSVSSSRS